MADKTTTGRKARQYRTYPEDFIDRLASGQSFMQIATELQCSRAVVRKWAESPPVKLALSERAADIHAAAVHKLTTMVGGALSALEDVVGDSEQPGTARVRAAEAILDRAGLPSTSAVELSGGLTLGAIPVAAQERVVVEEAVDILRSWGLHEAADAVAQALADRAP